MLLPWRKARKSVGARVGLQLDASGATLAQMGSDGKARVVRTACERTQWREATESLAKELGLSKGTAVTLVLPPEAYSLLLIEPPDVPFAEIKEAVRWRIRELLSFPAEEAVIDVFPFPEDAQRGRKTVFVVAAHRPGLAERIEAIGPSRLVLRAIDITELSIRNLLEGAGTAPLAVLQATDGVGTITLLRGERVYLSRRIELKDLTADRTIDQALLQLQRSLDYFESQLGQGLASAVVVALPLEAEADWIKRLQEMLPVPVHALSQWVETSFGLVGVPSAAAGALGGAMRAAS